jgi:deoxyribodipyrimidine photo-lyase
MSATAANAAGDGATMRRDFQNRDELIAYLRREFPAAAAIDDSIPATQGGRAAAEGTLSRIDPAVYAATRNRLNGAVTHLSPYLRHDVLSLAEVRDAVLRRTRPAQGAAKLINELGWRDYFQRVYAQIGGQIWRDLESYKTGWAPSDYAESLPADIASGETELACVDAFSRDLSEHGYLHNHARMWLASYVVHFRRVRWQAGARWFLTHLLDGDPASNNLSWQWVASTFSHKPYIFNRENLEKYTDGVYCRRCPLKGRCVFEGSYERIEQRLFPRQHTADPLQPDVGRLLTDQLADQGEKPEVDTARFAKLIVWIHGDNLNPHSSALAVADAPAVWVWDAALLSRARLSLKRILFVYECLLELPVTIRRGDVATEVLRFATEHSADGVVTNASISPGFAVRRHQIERLLPVIALAEAPFVEAHAGLDLRRFARYWRKVERSAMMQTRQAPSL